MYFAAFVNKMSSKAQARLLTAMIAVVVGVLLGAARFVFLI
jgi:hypothetical protein